MAGREIDQSYASAAEELSGKWIEGYASYAGGMGAVGEVKSKEGRRFVRGSSVNAGKKDWASFGGSGALDYARKSGILAQIVSSVKALPRIPGCVEASTSSVWHVCFYYLTPKSLLPWSLTTTIDYK